MMAVVTGFGVIFAICASRSFAPASVCLASTTMTPVLPMMIVLFPPAPPRPTHTSGLSIFIVSVGGACWAMPEMQSAPHASKASPNQRILEFDIGFSFREENSTTYGTRGIIEKQDRKPVG